MRILRLVVVTPPAPVGLSVHVDRSAYDYGQAAHLVAHLGDSGSSRDVALYATVGGVRRPVASGPVDTNGDFKAASPVREATTFTAVFAGDDDYSSRVVSTAVKVRARVVSGLRRDYGSLHGYHLYRAGDHPKSVVVVSPEHQGQCVRFRAQHASRGHWRTFNVSDCRPLDSTGWAFKTTYSHTTVGSRLRIRAEWPGDMANLAKNSAWNYARFTR